MNSGTERSTNGSLRSGGINGMKKVFGVLAVVSFICLFGSVGAVEQDMVTLGAGFIYMALSLAAFSLFTWLAGGFDYSYTYDEDEF